MRIQYQSDAKAAYCSRPLLCAAALALGILGQTTAPAQLGGVPLWTNRYNGPANGDDQARAMVLDSSGNVFVTGSSAGVGSGLDYATIKYSGAGVPLWTNFYNGPGNGDDVARAIAVDGSGNVFVTGSSAGIGSGNDYATVGYSSAGVALWTNRYNGPGNGDDQATAMAVDGSGNVFVTGYSAGSGGDLDYATIKYSGAGAALWTNRYNGPGNGDDQASAMAVDGSGNVFVTGRSVGTNLFGYPNYATIRYASDGTALWTNRYAGPFCCFDYANAVAVDRSGNVLVTGSSDDEYGTIKYSAAGTPLWTNLDNPPGRAVAVAADASGNVFVTGYSLDHVGTAFYTTLKYSGAGVALWSRDYFGVFGNNADYPTAMAVDGSGNVLVTGYSFGGGSGYDYATVAYSGAGAQLWVNRYNEPGSTNAGATAVAVDGSGNVLVTGYSLGSGSGYDYATIKYSLIPPSLSVALTPTNTVAVSWPSPSTGFTLQQNTNGLETLNWSNVLATPSDDGTTKTVIVDPPTGNRFYRLFHP